MFHLTAAARKPIKDDSKQYSPFAIVRNCLQGDSSQLGPTGREPHKPYCKGFYLLTSRCHATQRRCTQRLGHCSTEHPAPIPRPPPDLDLVSALYEKTLLIGLRSAPSRITCPCAPRSAPGAAQWLRRRCAVSRGYLDPTSEHLMECNCKPSAQTVSPLICT